MSDASTLAARLAALAEETPTFDGRARILNQDGATIEQIIDEVDATVLASALTFDTGKGRLTLHVAGRRLHMMSDVDGSVPDPDGVLGKTLAVEDEDLRNQSAKTLLAFVKSADVLALIAEPSSLIDGDAPDSMSVTALRAACGVETFDDAHMDPMDRILNRAGDHITAWIRMNGNRLDSTSGNVAEISSLKIVLTTQLSTFEQTRSKACASHSDPSLTCCLDASKSGQSLGLAAFGDSKLLLSLPTQDIGLLYRVFRQVV